MVEPRQYGLSFLPLGFSAFSLHLSTTLWAPTNICPVSQDSFILIIKKSSYFWWSMKEATQSRFFELQWCTVQEFQRSDTWQGSATYLLAPTSKLLTVLNNIYSPCTPFGATDLADLLFLKTHTVLKNGPCKSGCLDVRQSLRIKTAQTPLWALKNPANGLLK